MKTSYNVEYLPERRKSTHREAPEITAIKGLLACKDKNVCFEYDDENQANNRLRLIQRFRNGNELREVFDCYRSGVCVYVVRTKEKGRPSKEKENESC